jgi:hypothetical protein
VQDANNVSLRYSKLWGGALNLEERSEFLAMVERTAMAHGGINNVQRMKIAKLRERLGLAD